MPGTLAYLKEKCGGTTPGRQELGGELLEDIEGALWNRRMLDACRVGLEPAMRRGVIAIDPTIGASKISDETDIIACGRAADGRGYVVRDLSGRYSLDGWARRAVNLYHDLQADRIVAEFNFGDGMVEATIRSVDPLEL